MKTLVAALISIALIAGPANALSLTNDYSASNRAYLVDLYTQVSGEAPSAEILAELNEIAAFRSSVDMSLRSATNTAGQHVGEIWTDCLAFFGEVCDFQDPAGTTATCQGSVPAHWAYYQWVAAPSAVSLLEGFHTTWTESHLGGALSGAHSSASLVGTTCADVFVGFAIFTYTNGAGEFQ